MSAEFETVAIDSVSAAAILEHARFIGREWRCQVQITVPVTARAWHVAIRCPTTGLTFGEMNQSLPEAWRKVTEDWYFEMQKKAPGLARAQAGL